MKMIHTIRPMLITAALLVIGTQVSGFAELRAVPATEFTVDLRALSPSKQEHWDDAGGIEAQFIFWQPQGVGLGLAVGYQSWRAPSEFIIDSDADSTLAFSSEGSMALLPIGASVHYRMAAARAINLTLEAGLRYVLVDSAIDIETVYSDAYGSSRLTDRVVCDDTVTAVLGFRLEFLLDASLRLFCGAGYQKDLLEPTESVYGETLGRTSFDAASFSLGVSYSF